MEVVTPPGRSPTRSSGVNVAAKNITLVVHYFPPINSSGARRMLAMAKYFARAGRSVTVITTRKGASDGAFTEPFPPGVKVIELSASGRAVPSKHDATRSETSTIDGSRRGIRKLKDAVMSLLGQLPDPRLPFALSFLRRRLDPAVRLALVNADVIIATTPPWPPLLIAAIAKRRFKKRIVLDYRDQFSHCHEMPGGPFAKKLESKVDRWLTKRADALVSISPPMAEYYSSFNDQNAVILNGFDPEPLRAAMERRPHSVSNGPVVIRYLGLVSRGRIPYALLAALKKLSADGKIDSTKIAFEYFGDVGLLHAFLRDHYPDLLSFFQFQPQVSYNKALELIVSADHLMFCENAIPPQDGEALSSAGILTTKLFEYLASTRPIIAHISDETLAGSFIKRASEDHFLSESQHEFEDFLMSDRFRNPAPVTITDFVKSLSRASQAQSYIRLLDDLVEGKPIPHDLRIDAYAQ